MVTVSILKCVLGSGHSVAVVCAKVATVRVVVGCWSTLIVIGIG